MSTKDLRELLRTAKRFGLKRLKTPEYEFEFSDKEPIRRSKAAKVFKQEENLRNREDELANLLITDPTAYEEIMADTIKVGN